MAVRTFGIEEELLLVDPRTRLAAPRSAAVLKALAEQGGGDPGGVEDLDHELFRHQLETRTDPVSTPAEALTAVRAARRTAVAAATALDLAVAACGTAPLGVPTLHGTRDDRYADMLERYGEVALSGGTCGMHVHVAVDDPEEGVAVLDRIAPWLPLVLAVSANSPFADGRDTRHASWRSQVWSRWPSAGPTEPFGTLQGYREVCAAMVAYGAARDDGMLYFDARLSAGQPTVEVRVADVCTDPEDAVLVAVLVRALVETAARQAGTGAPAPRWRAELLRAASWRAARLGPTATLVHPLAREPRPAREVLEALRDATADALAEAGDTDLVTAGLERVLRRGGAAGQRAAYERTGQLEAVVDDLVARTTGQDAVVV